MKTILYSASSHNPGNRNFNFGAIIGSKMVVTAAIPRMSFIYCFGNSLTEKKKVASDDVVHLVGEILVTHID